MTKLQTKMAISQNALVFQSESTKREKERREMPKHPKTSLRGVQAVRMISRIRARNNVCWMSLLRIAMESSPVRTREVITKISKNDREITKWLGRI